METVQDASDCVLRLLLKHFSKKDVCFVDKNYKICIFI